MMHNKTKIYIYGDGLSYNRFCSYLPRYIDEFEILGILTTRQPIYRFLDGFECRKADTFLSGANDYDFIVIAIQAWKEIYDYLLSLGVSPKKIIRGSIFELPYFEWDEWLCLHEDSPTILCNNCLAGLIYKELGLPANSPTINAFCGEMDYLKFVREYGKYLDLDMEEYDIVKHSQLQIETPHNFMVNGVIEDIVWHFNHSYSASASVSKWNEKRRHINASNVKVIMVITSDSGMKEFQSLDIKGKLGIYYKDAHCKQIIFDNRWDKDISIRVKFDFNWGHYCNYVMTNQGSEPGYVNWLRFLRGKENYIRHD